MVGSGTLLNILFSWNMVTCYFKLLCIYQKDSWKFFLVVLQKQNLPQNSVSDSSYTHRKKKVFRISSKLQRYTVSG